MSKKINKSKQSIEEFLASEDYPRAMKLENIAFLCHSVANQAREEVDALMEKYGLLTFDLSHYSKNLFKAFNLYDYALKHLVEKGAWIDISNDYEIVRKTMYVYAGVEEKDDSQTKSDNNE